MTTVKGFFNWTNTKLIETFFYSHDDNELGSIKNDKVRMQKAFDIGVGILERKLNSSSIC
jgi:hypothetical protein